MDCRIASYRQSLDPTRRGRDPFSDNRLYLSKCVRCERMKKAELKKHWLASNAVVVFIGVLLVARSWVSGGTIDLLSICTVTLPGWVFLLIVVFLLLLSAAFALATKIRWLQRRMFCTARYSSLVLGFVIYVAFLLDWFGALAELGDNKLLLYLILFSGAVMFLFIIFNLVLPRFTSREPNRPKSHEDGLKAPCAASLRGIILVGGFVLFLFILGRISSGRPPEGGD